MGERYPKPSKENIKAEPKAANARAESLTGDEPAPGVDMEFEIAFPEATVQRRTQAERDKTLLEDNQEAERRNDERTLGAKVLGREKLTAVDLAQERAIEENVLVTQEAIEAGEQRAKAEKEKAEIEKAEAQRELVELKKQRTSLEATIADKNAWLEGRVIVSTPPIRMGIHGREEITRRELGGLGVPEAEKEMRQAEFELSMVNLRIKRLEGGAQEAA
jgi:hypothetical protein